MKCMAMLMSILALSVALASAAYAHGTVPEDVPEGADLWLQKALIALDPDDGRSAMRSLELAGMMLDAYLAEPDGAYLAEYLSSMESAASSMHSFNGPGPRSELATIYNLQEEAVLLELHLLSEGIYGQNLLEPVSSFLVASENKKHSPRIALMYSEGSFRESEGLVYDAHMASMADYAFLFSSAAIHDASASISTADASGLDAPVKKQFASAVSILEQAMDAEERGDYLTALELALASQRLVSAALEGVRLTLDDALPFRFGNPRALSLDTADLPGL